MPYAVGRSMPYAPVKLVRLYVRRECFCSYVRRECFLDGRLLLLGVASTPTVTVAPGRRRFYVGGWKELGTPFFQR